MMEALKFLNENIGLLIFMLIMIFLLYIFWLLIEFMMQKRTIRQNQSLNFNVRDSININEQQTETEICVICHDPISNKVELDCKDRFCLKCIMEYSRSHREKLPCPVCHKIIFMINPLLTLRNEQTAEYYDLITEFNYEFLTGNNYFKYYFVNFPYIFYRGVLNVVEDPVRGAYFLAFGIAALIYFLTPYDLVPDYIWFLGYCDDMIILFAFIFGITHTFYPDFKDKNEREMKLIRSN